MTGAALVLDAIAFAAAAHLGQTRKDGITPYIHHPIALARLLAYHGVDDPVLLAAAALHDTVEDCAVTPAELAARFGPEVAAVVAEVTDDKGLSFSERKRRQVETAPRKSARAKQLKLADATCNLTDLIDTPPRDWDDTRRRDYFDWALKVAAGLRGVNPALDAAFDRAYARRP